MKPFRLHDFPLNQGRVQFRIQAAAKGVAAQPLIH